MPPKKKKKSEASEASPARSVGRELVKLQSALRLTVRVYEKRLADDLTSVMTWNDEIAKLAAPPRARIRDLGDMLGLLRKLKLKPEKGRRRDLRKIDSVIEDLVLLSRPKRA